MANTFNLGNGNWAQKTEKLLAYNAENDNYKPLPFDFDRGSTATRVNKQGLIETVGIDKPRIDFLNNTKGHLLLEPSRSNLVTNSEQFVDAPTGNTNMDLFSGTITNNNTTSPDGNVKGMKFTISSGSGAVLRIYQSDLSTSANTTFSIYAKKGTTDSLSINIAGGTATIATLNDKWQRFSTTDTSSGSKFLDVEISGNAGEYIYIFGIQAEQGSYATSYIPTSGSAVTRSAETCSGAGNDQVINSTEGVLYVDMRNDIVQQQTIALLKGSNDSVQLGLINGNIRLAVVSNGNATLSTLSPAFTYKNGLYNKYAIVWNNTNAKIFINGELKSTISTPSPLGLEYLSFNNQASSENMSGNIKDIKVYNTTLTDAELIALTS